MTRAIETGTPIPEEFVYRAAKHFAETGAPLLLHRATTYRHELLAWGNGEEYQLSDALWTPPSWREHAGRMGVDVEQLIDNYRDSGWIGADDPDPDPDALLSQELAALVVGDADNELASALRCLEGLGITHFTCPSLPNAALLGLDLGKLQAWEGRFPGDDFTSVYATTPLALSCLQFALDEMGAAIRITLAEEAEAPREGSDDE